MKNNSEMIECLKIILSKYENLDVTCPKECTEPKDVEEYKYLSSIKGLICRNVPIMISWLETGILPKEEFEEIARVSQIVRGPHIEGRDITSAEIENLENEIIAAQKAMGNSKR